MTHRRTLLPLLSLGIALAVLLAAYLPTLQTIPNGSENYYMIDVGETQIVLNRWGTLHATGYPLFVMIGGALVSFLRAFGIPPATAPAVVALFWGILTLTLTFILALHLTRRPLLAAGLIVVYGLTRTVWIHNDIAEIYTMTLCLLVILLLIALWQPPIRGRLCWLAFAGGIAVAHHRALAMAIPALVIAVLPELIAAVRKRPIFLLLLLGLGLLGLIPYAYLYLRAQTGAAWVYGEPGTLQGLIDQFMGREADRFIGLPGSLDALLANVNLVNGVLLTDLTLPGIVAGTVGLIVGWWTHRRAARVLIVSGAAAYLFHAVFYSDILSALILSVTLSLAFGWLFLAEWLLNAATIRRDGFNRAGLKPAPTGDSPIANPYMIVTLLVVTVAFGGYLASENAPFIAHLTGDTTGLETIALAQRTPPGATLMLAWGPRYFAVGFARDVLGLLPGVSIVSHKADYRAIVQTGMLVTPAYTFYNQPVQWWRDQLDAPVYLRAVAPDLVQIDTKPEMVGGDVDDASGVVEAAHRIECMSSSIVLKVAWEAGSTPPPRDLSVFVHLLDAGGGVIAQDDQGAPVYGWRPLTSWAAHEVVRDVYSLPRLPDAAAVRYGLYTQRADGSFDNVLTYSLPVECG